jgi:hypothetical protein
MYIGGGHVEGRLKLRCCEDDDAYPLKRQQLGKYTVRVKELWISFFFFFFFFKKNVG